MKKEDLNFGNVVELRNGRLCLIEPINNYGYYETLKQYLEESNFTIKIRDIKNATYVADLSSYNDNLTHKDFDDYSIIRVYKDYTLKELLWERKEINTALLTNEEREFIKNTIEFYNGMSVNWIAKGKKYLKINNKRITLKIYMRKIKFENLEENKKYTLEELGL